MALIVEDGTGLSNADALISLSYADNFHTDRNNTDWIVASTDKKEASIRNTSSFLMHSFTWEGFPVGLRDQTMPFPRVDLNDRYGYYVASDIVPREVQEAVALLALYDFQNAGAFTQAVHNPQTVLKRKKVGPLEKEYAVFVQDRTRARPDVVFALDLLGPFMSEQGSNNSLVGKRTRG